MALRIPSIKEIASDKIKMSYAGAFVVLSIFAYFLLAVDDLGTMKRLKNDYAETYKNLDTLKRTSDYISYIGDFDSRLAADKGANWMIEVITGIAKAEGVTLEFLKPAETKNLSGYRIVRVIAEGGGPYMNVIGFVSKIESYDRLFFVEEFSLSSVDARVMRGGRIGARPNEMLVTTVSPFDIEEPGAGRDAEADAGRVTKFKMVIAAFNKEQ